MPGWALGHDRALGLFRHGRCYPTLSTGFSEHKQALALILGYPVHAGCFPRGVLYPVAACSSGGAIMRRLDWRSGCGACGWFRKPSPGASGLLPGPTTRARRVADAPGRTQAEACGIRPKGRSGCRTEQSRRQKPPRWSAERRACLARHAPRLASVELLTRLSALRSLGYFSGQLPGPLGKKDRRTRRLTKHGPMTLGCLTL